MTTSKAFSIFVVTFVVTFVVVFTGLTVYDLLKAYNIVP
jgi:hypothetical protein